MEKQFQDIRVKKLLDKILCNSKKILGSNLLGIYIHGSLAMNCFTWNTSDVDFIVVTENVPSLQSKKAYVRMILDVDKEAPSKGLEMSMLTEKACRCFRHPVPFELHFSHGHLLQAEKNVDVFAEEMHGEDRDLAAHMMITRKYGITLCGPMPDTLFPVIPDPAYTDALLYDIENAEDEIMKDPVYMTLNLCRIVAWLEEKRILSKKEGGEWGIMHLPSKYRDLLSWALALYSGSEDYFKSACKDQLSFFAAYMMERIRKQI